MRTYGGACSLVNGNQHRWLPPASISTCSTATPPAGPSTTSNQGQAGRSVASVVLLARSAYLPTRQKEGCTTTRRRLAWTRIRHTTQPASASTGTASATNSSSLFLQQAKTCQRTLPSA